LTAELPLLFGTHYEYRGNSTEYEWQDAQGMQGKFAGISHQVSANNTIDLWFSFALNPNKSPADGNGITWPLYKPGQKRMAVFAETGKKWFQLGAESLTEKQCTKS